jgi:hypothetical protein
MYQDGAIRMKDCEPCIAIHITDKFSQQHTIQFSYAGFSRHSLGLHYYVHVPYFDKENIM